MGSKDFSNLDYIFMFHQLILHENCQFELCSTWLGFLENIVANHVQFQASVTCLLLF